MILSLNTELLGNQRLQLRDCWLQILAGKTPWICCKPGRTLAFNWKSEKLLGNTLLWECCKVESHQIIFSSVLLKKKLPLNLKMMVWATALLKVNFNHFSICMDTSTNKPEAMLSQPYPCCRMCNFKPYARIQNVCAFQLHNLWALLHSTENSLSSLQHGQGDSQNVTDFSFLSQEWSNTACSLKWWFSATAFSWLETELLRTKKKK